MVTDRYLQFCVQLDVLLGHIENMLCLTVRKGKAEERVAYGPFSGGGVLQGMPGSPAVHQSLVLYQGRSKMSDIGGERERA